MINLSIRFEYCIDCLVFIFKLLNILKLDLLLKFITKRKVKNNGKRTKL